MSDPEHRPFSEEMKLPQPQPAVEDSTGRLGQPSTGYGCHPPGSQAADRCWRYRTLMFDEAVIAEAGRRLCEAAPAAQVFLFGSYARGTADRRSDLDFLVIEPSVSDAGEESIRLRTALRGLRLFADVVVVSEGDVERWAAVPGTLIHSALSEGRELAGVRGDA